MIEVLAWVAIAVIALVALGLVILWMVPEDDEATELAKWREEWERRFPY